MKSLSSRQEEILTFLANYQSERGFPPTIREISEHFHMYPRAASDHLKALERKGYLAIHPGKSRAVKITEAHLFSPNTIPVVGRIAAGSPIFALENLEDTIKLDSTFFSMGKCFGLKVQGDSMVEAHIQDGDYVVLKQQSFAENGDTVAVLIGEEVTLKHYYRKGDRIELRPANPNVKPIIITPNSGEPRILGVMVGLIRRKP